MKKRLTAIAVLIPAGLAVTALPAAASGTVILQYSGGAIGSTAVDSSGHGNDGTLHNVTATGGAYSFNGTNSYVSAPASSTINPGTRNFSYSVSIKLPAGYTYTRDISLVRRGASKFAGAYYKMEMVYNKSTGNMRLECALRDSTGGRGFVATSANTLNDGAWHTLTCAKTATTVSLTKDAHTYTKPANLADMSSGTQPLNFGAEQVSPTGFWEHFPGLMDNIILTKS
jgi:hypothetical protein